MSIAIKRHPAQEMAEGDGARVRRLMPIHGCLNFDPIVLWDDFSIQPGAGFPDHPHRGFEGITYLFSGAQRHTDNLGNDRVIAAGGVQRFNAGSGIVHSEMPESDGVTRGIQLWINLPQRLKRMAPSYQQAEAGELPQRAFAGGRERIIVGPGSPIALQTPAHYRDVDLEAGADYAIELPENWRGLVYAVDGSFALGADGLGLATGEAGLLSGAGTAAVHAERACRFMLCIGQSHGEPIRQWGPFVD